MMDSVRQPITSHSPAHQDSSWRLVQRLKIVILRKCVPWASFPMEFQEGQRGDKETCLNHGLRYWYA